MSNVTKVTKRWFNSEEEYTNLANRNLPLSFRYSKHFSQSVRPWQGERSGILKTISGIKFHEPGESAMVSLYGLFFHAGIEFR